MTAKDSELTYQQKSSLETIKNHVLGINSALDGVENKANQNFTIINIILAAVGAVNLLPGTSVDIVDAIRENPLFVATYLPTIILIFAYFQTAGHSRRAISIESRGTHPILVEHEEVKNWLKYSASEYYEWTVDAYISIYKQNKDILQSKSKSVKCGHWWIGIAIGAVMFQVVFSGGAAFLLY